MKDDDVELSGLLVDLDSIFDTRLGLMASLDDQSILEQNYNEAYFTRDRDVFNGISEKDWYEKYNARDRKVLLKSQITPVVGFIREFIYETLTGNINSPQLLKPYVHVNVWPYKLQDAEKKLLLKGLLTHIGTDADVEIVEIPIEALTPAVIKSRYSMLVMYGYELWIAAHFSNAEQIKQTCPEVGLLGPRVLKQGAHVKTNVDDVFSFTEERMGVIVTLRHNPASMFSTIMTPQRLRDAHNAAQEQSSQTA